nr:MAG TPA: hypothetical protein [Caudoviricetes sp.]
MHNGGSPAVIYVFLQIPTMYGKLSKTTHPF